jgi:hypothetical protein
MFFRFQKKHKNGYISWYTPFSEPNKWWLTERGREKKNICMYVYYIVLCTYSMEYPDEISRKIGEIPVDGDIP